MVWPMLDARICLLRGLEPCAWQFWPPGQATAAGASLGPRPALLGVPPCMQSSLGQARFRLATGLPLPTYRARRQRAERKHDLLSLPHSGKQHRTGMQRGIVCAAELLLCGLTSDTGGEHTCSGIAGSGLSGARRAASTTAAASALGLAFLPGA